MPRKRSDDFQLFNHGSIVTLHAKSRRAKTWVDENVAQSDETQYWGSDGIVIEPRYVDAIVDGIYGDGLTVAGV